MVIGLFELAVVVGGIIRPVMNKLENLSVELPLGLQYNSVGVIRKILNCTLLDSRNIRRNTSWIETPRVNKLVFSPSCDLTKTSTFWSCTGSIEPLDTFILISVNQERYYTLLCIEKLGVKIVVGDIFPELDPSKQVNLVNSVLSESPKFKSLGHPTVNTTDIRPINFVSSTRANTLSSMQKNNVSLSMLGYTHDFETMSKMTAYCNHIENSEFENREVFVGEKETTLLTRQTDLMTNSHNNPLT